MGEGDSRRSEKQFLVRERSVSYSRTRGGERCGVGADNNSLFSPSRLSNKALSAMEPPVE